MAEREIEPRVLTSDVRRILAKVIQPEDIDHGATLKDVADRAKLSTRTVKRVLSNDQDTITLDTADRLCLAVGLSVTTSCTMVWPDGTTEAPSAPPW